MTSDFVVFFVKIMLQKGYFVMIKVFFAFVFMTLIAFLHLSYAEDVVRQGLTIEAIQKKGEIVVGMVHGDSQPYYFTVDGETIGFDAKLAYEVGEELGVKVKFDNNTPCYDSIAPRVASREIDIAISCLSKTEERMKLIDFSDPYIIGYSSIFYNRVSFAKSKNDRSFVPKKLSDFNRPDINILVESGTVFVTLAHEYLPKATIIPIHVDSKYFPIIASIEKGEFCGVMGDEGDFLSILHRNPEGRKSIGQFQIKRESDDIERNEECEYEDLISVGVPKNSPELLELINRVIKKRGVASIDQVLDEFEKYNSSKREGY